MNDEPHRPRWARKAQAIAQAGLAYSGNEFDQEWYRALREPSVEMLAHIEEAGIDMRPRRKNRTDPIKYP